MKGTRIMLALANKLACRQNEAKVKRVQKSLEVAKTNAEEQAAQAADALDEVIQNFNKDSDVQELIQDISDAMCAADEAAETIAQLEKIEKFLFEELEVPDMPEE